MKKKPRATNKFFTQPSVTVTMGAGGGGGGSITGLPAKAIKPDLRPYFTLKVQDYPSTHKWHGRSLKEAVKWLRKYGS